MVSGLFQLTADPVDQDGWPRSASWSPFAGGAQALLKEPETFLSSPQTLDHGLSMNKVAQAKTPAPKGYT